MEYIKRDWPNKIIKIIENKLGNISKGWFNLKESNKTSYLLGKLKRFFTLIRLRMQDALNELI